MAGNSQLRDFRICQISGFEETKEELLNKNGHFFTIRRLSKLKIIHNNYRKFTTLGIVEKNDLENLF